MDIKHCANIPYHSIVLIKLVSAINVLFICVIIFNRDICCKMCNKGKVFRYSLKSEYKTDKYYPFNIGYFINAINNSIY